MKEGSGYYVAMGDELMNDRQTTGASQSATYARWLGEAAGLFTMVAIAPRLKTTQPIVSTHWIAPRPVTRATKMRSDPVVANPDSTIGLALDPGVIE